MKKKKREGKGSGLFSKKFPQQDINPEESNPEGAKKKFFSIAGKILLALFLVITLFNTDRQ